MFKNIEAEDGNEPEDCVDEDGQEEEFGVAEGGESYERVRYE